MLGLSANELYWLASSGTLRNDPQGRDVGNAIFEGKGYEPRAENIYHPLNYVEPEEEKDGPE